MFGFTLFEQVDASPNEWYVIFNIKLPTLFKRADFSSERVGSFFFTWLTRSVVQVSQDMRTAYN